MHGRGEAIEARVDLLAGERSADPLLAAAAAAPAHAATQPSPAAAAEEPPGVGQGDLAEIGAKRNNPVSDV